MSTAFLDAVVYAANKNIDYGKRLLVGTPDDKMLFQPAPGTNHPAWVFSHLNVYINPMLGLVKGTPFEDPKGHKFGMTSKPESDASLYLPKAQLLADFENGHKAIVEAIKAAGPSVLEKPTGLERWRNVMPTTGIVLNYLLTLHIATHLGQISTWRRVQGMPSV